MTTFVWREILSVNVGEMSRTQAIECCRKFDALLDIFSDYAEQLAEADILVVLEAPVVIKIKGDVFSVGERVIELPDDQSFKLTLPLTRDGFDALPMSLTVAWVNAALVSNEWFIDTLKKSLVTMTSAPESDNERLPAPNIAYPTMTTTGT